MNDERRARLEWGDVIRLGPEANRAMGELGAAVKRAGLEPRLLELVKVRVSQINGCAFCLQMHAGTARQLGEVQERLDVLAGWREARVFSPRERAALGWAEAMTVMGDERARDEAYRAAAGEFDERELLHLTWAIVHINGWNRVVVGFRFTPGTTREATVKEVRSE